MSSRNPFKRLAARATGDKVTTDPTGSSSTSDPFISPNPTGTTVSDAHSAITASDGKHGRLQDPFVDLAGAASEGAGSSSQAPSRDVANAMSNLSISTQPPPLPQRRDTVNDNSPPDTPHVPSPTASPPPHTPPRTPTQGNPSTSGSPPPLPPRQSQSTISSSPPSAASHAVNAAGGPHARTASPPPPSFMSIEEDPPDYTPTPDYRHGEETLEYGPARPFQRPPQPPQGHQGWSPQQQPRPNGPYLSPHPTGVLLSPQATGRRQSPSLLGQLAAAVDRALDNLATPPGSTYGPGYAQQLPPRPPPVPPMPPRPPQVPRPPPAPNAAPPPPLHPQHTGVRPQPTGGAQPASDFARDFYAAGTGPPGASSTPQLSPAPTGNGAEAASTSRPAPDFRPTTVPTPGRPLLRDNRVLVYPAGVECAKCANTGYKGGDPARPCGRCWRKYARAYEGPLTYADFSPGGDGRMQRPLRPPPPSQPRPPVHRPHSSAGPPGAAYHGRRPGSAGSPYGHPPPRPYGPSATCGPAYGRSLRVPPGAPLLAHRPSWSAGPSVRSGFAAAPPGSIVYAPGDPRIGGAPCWRCGGDGTVTSFFGLDEDTCGTCGGIGRVFR